MADRPSSDGRSDLLMRIAAYEQTTYEYFADRDPLTRR